MRLWIDYLYDAVLTRSSGNGAACRTKGGAASSLHAHSDRYALAREARLMHTGGNQPIQQILHVCGSCALPQGAAICITCAKNCHKVCSVC